MGTFIAPSYIFQIRARCFVNIERLCPLLLKRLVWGFGDGSTLETTKTSLGILGSVICWENYMPMIRMAMYDQGNTIILHSNCR